MGNRLTKNKHHSAIVTCLKTKVILIRFQSNGVAGYDQYVTAPKPELKTTINNSLICFLRFPKFIKFTVPK